MTIHYKVWLEIEEIDEDRNHYETVDTPGGSLATFATYDEACRFVNQANGLLDSAVCFGLDVEPVGDIGVKNEAD